MAATLSVQQQRLKSVGIAMRSEADGKLLRRELIADLRVAVAPGIEKVRGKLRALPASVTGVQPAMGSYLASRVRAQVKFSGRRVGVAVRIGKTPNLRKFNVASRVLNRGEWRHRVYGKDVWVTQQSPIPGFFDKTLMSDRRAYRAAVVAAVQKMERRLAARARAGP
jgi:hypothetical protein